MALQNQDVTIWKGDHVQIPIYIEDAVSLLNFTAVWAMSNDLDSPKIIEKTTSSGIVFQDVTVIVTINPAETGQSSGLNPGDYYHELKLFDIQGKPFTVAVGTLTLKDVLNK